MREFVHRLMFVPWLMVSVGFSLMGGFKATESQAAMSTQSTQSGYVILLVGGGAFMLWLFQTVVVLFWILERKKVNTSSIDRAILFVIGGSLLATALNAMSGDSWNVGGVLIWTTYVIVGISCLLALFTLTQPDRPIVAKKS